MFLLVAFEQDPGRNLHMFPLRSFTIFLELAEEVVEFQMQICGDKALKDLLANLGRTSGESLGQASDGRSAAVNPSMLRMVGQVQKPADIRSTTCGPSTYCLLLNPLNKC